MSGSNIHGIVESVACRLPEQVAADTSSDGVLLERFCNERDETAFETLVLRHGPKVRRICRSWLGDGQDADDAVQATFIALLTRAGELRQSEAIGGWLTVVARRVAARARMRGERRRYQERGELADRKIAGRIASDPGDLCPTLRAEVDRLPEKYRRPIELCYWEGLSNEEAAERLQCPTGTVKWRLSRAREILRRRLARVGAALTALLMWRRTSTATAAVSESNLEVELALRPGRKSRRHGRGEGFLSANFVRETVALIV